MTVLLQIENILSSVDLPLPVLAFLAGIISILSPCILPLLPAILAYSTGKGTLRPLSIIAGLTLTFSLMGIGMAAFYEVFSFYRQYLTLAAEIVIIMLGIAMITEFNPLILDFSGKIPIDPHKDGIVGGLILGLSLGIVWIPCTGPILTAILMGVLLKGGILYGGSLLFIYSLGLGVPMLLIAYSANISGRKLSTISRYNVMIKKGAGAVLILVGFWMVYTNHLWLYV